MCRKRKMSESEKLNLPSLLPPKKKNLVTKDKLFMVMELLWLIFIYAPYQLLLNLYRKIFPPPGKSLKGQVVIVTGAGRGLGRGLALRFAQEGAKVAVVDLDRASASQTTQAIVDAGGVAKAFFTNVGSPGEIKELQLSTARDLGPADIVVNNAGLIYAQSMDDMTEAEVRAVMDVNLLSHFWIAQQFLPEMKRRNSGHIVAMCSLAAIFTTAYGFAYCASKSALSGFMEALRAELNLNPINNIKTTTILPYFINTSEDYVNFWDLRIPPLSIEEVVEATVTAVKREEVLLSVPRRSYFFLLSKLLPIEIHDKLFSIFYVRIILQSRKSKDEDRTQQIISEVAKKYQY